MYPPSMTGMKLAASKLLSGALLAPPLTISIGPGLVAIGIFGAACISVYMYTVNSLSHGKSSLSVATPPI
ncbi:hypothetical protein MSR1_03590 [Magnetospirillum gryphiswaldense MSR-1]|uniref:Uncharacterized protein n=1 Tax=Magnetospirillum gryphiswaldense TaxID=55518 RepID=Q3BK92_9PROT|nr:hypothetical protein MSR1_03590 [Magnetospirillum gryphiswaldense MSR-1]AVM76776.1 hypothetical protein MSR1L_03590 [Magnetospirillum gryphiswaldense]CAJ30139.1 hypothetical protein mgIa20 [Magnetospirillum gryphiswaldense MSR-1]CAM78046.1 hypothetical protein MGR_4114 [Magnetospirillum gryphiswaldense MSR-1]